MRDLTKKQFTAALSHMGWRSIGWQDDGSPYRHEATKTTSYGPHPCTRRQLVEYLAEVSVHRQSLFKGNQA